MSLTTLCMFWCCLGCVVLVAVFVDFRLSEIIFLRMGVPEEQDGAVVGVCWPLPSSLACGPLGTLNTHFWL